MSFYTTISTYFHVHRLQNDVTLSIPSSVKDHLMTKIASRSLRKPMTPVNFTGFLNRLATLKVTAAQAQLADYIPHR